MKKFLTISFLALYLTLSTGVNILIHTCGGESTALVATGTVEDPCGCDDAEESEKCCTTELKSVRLDDVQKISVGPLCESLTVLETLPVISGTAGYSADPFVVDRLLTSFSPPPPDDLCVVHSVFRI